MNRFINTLHQYHLHETKRWPERLIVWLAAIVTGFIIVGFTQVTTYSSELFEKAKVLADWAPLIITPIGGMFIVYCVHRWFRGAEGSGIPQVIHTLEHIVPGERQPLIAFRIVMSKIGLGILALGCGFSVGREGPSVQIGAGTMYWFRHFLPKGYSINPRYLILAGGAAGLAAAFNTPLAGIVFAIEELSRKFEQHTNGVLLTAIILAGMVSVSLQGNYLYFGKINVPVINYHIIVPAIICALVCGLAGGLFSRSLLWTTRGFPLNPITHLRQRHPVIFAGLCGLLISALSLLTHGATQGSGYAAAYNLLEGEDSLSVLFAPIKWIVTLLSYFSGVPGGIFAPSLAVGVGIGHDLLPFLNTTVAPAGIYALCMAAFLSAVTQAPITSCIIVMEMIDGHGMVISLMGVALLASLISRLFSPPLYHTLATPADSLK